MAIKGVDISEHNGSVNFSTLKNNGVEFVIIRLGYGSNYTNQDDKRFAENVKKAEAAGMPWGAYLYSYAKNTSMAKSEAEHALRLLKGKTPLYGVWYDVEDPQLSGVDVVATSQTFCDAMENAGYYAGIYASLSWLNGSLSSSKLDKYDKWVAQWNSSCTYKKAYGIWQYTEKLVIGGKNFDGNWAYKDYPSIIKAMNGEKEPEKEEDDLTKEEVKKIARQEIVDYLKELGEKPASDGWGEEAVAWAKDHGVAAGDPNGNMRPRSLITREESMKMIQNYHEHTR